MGIKITDITPKNIRNVIEGTYNYHSSNTANHIQEQAAYRAYLCQPCLQAGHCLKCGCKTPQMFYAPKKVDAAGRWGKMLSKDKWEEFKTQNYDKHTKFFNSLNSTDNSNTNIPSDDLDDGDTGTSTTADSST